MFILTGVLKSTNNYTSGIPKQLCTFECDTVNDLPNISQTNYEIEMGSSAHIIEDNSLYAMQSDGTWKVQETGTDVYTKQQIMDILEEYQTKLTFDTIPTAQSTNPVTSGGLLNEIWGSSNRLLQSGDDLNFIDFWQVGSFRCESRTIARSLLNCPTDSGFRMFVISTIASVSTGYQQQIIFPNNSNGEIFIRRRTTGTNAGSWFLIQGVAVSPINPQNTNSLQMGVLENE